MALRPIPSRTSVTSRGLRLSGRVRLIAPVMMDAPCVGCHNSHPDSPKRDWKVGDVRGIQEITVSQPMGTNLLAFKYLLVYLVLAAVPASPSS